MRVSSMKSDRLRVSGPAARLVVRPVINRLAYDRGELLSQERSPKVLAARQARTYEGPVGNLNRWVDTVRARTGESIPYFDPAAARDGAHVLILLQDPSQEADAGSGFISRHNNDPTARNTYIAADEAGLSYDRSIHWNVVPWWVANPERQPVGRRRTLREEAIRARPFLIDLLNQMTVKPRVVILAGKEAQKAWQTLAGDAALPDLADLKVLECPHPGPLVYPRTDQTGRLNNSVIIEKFREAAELTERREATPSYQGVER
jgi:uracil-DNA glycosylase